MSDDRLDSSNLLLPKDIPVCTNPKNQGSPLQVSNIIAKAPGESPTLDEQTLLSPGPLHLANDNRNWQLPFAQHHPAAIPLIMGLVEIFCALCGCPLQEVAYDPDLLPTDCTKVCYELPHQEDKKARSCDISCFH